MNIERYGLVIGRTDLPNRVHESVLVELQEAAGLVYADASTLLERSSSSCWPVPTTFYFSFLIKVSHVNNILGRAYLVYVFNLDLKLWLNFYWISLRLFLLNQFRRVGLYVAFLWKSTTYVGGIPSNLTKHWQQELEPRWWNTREMISKVGRLTLYFS